MKSLKFLIKILFFSLIVVGCSPVEEVNVYTSRHYDVDDILYAEFTKKTGIKVNIISGSGGALMERLKAEGQNSPGDVFFTVDAGNLANFQKAGFLQQIKNIFRFISYRFVNNFARTPQGNDRSQLMAVANGLADIAIANTYYVGIMLAGKGGEEQRKAAQKLKIAFPNQDNRGTHVNISGGGILRYSPNKKNAEMFLEFLLSEEAQSHIVNNSFEYPVINTIAPHPIIAKFGDFKMDKTSVADFGTYNPEAVKLMDRAGWK